MRTFPPGCRISSLPRRGFLAALTAFAAALLLVAGCGSAAPTQRVTAVSARHANSTAAPNSAGPSSAGPSSAGPASPPCAAGQIAPVGASFVSANEGFLLGVTLKQCWPDGTSKLRLRKTADGGLRWTPLTAPPAPWGGIAPSNGLPPADAVASVLFASARDGWAYGPGLWATHDGGASWHRIGTKGHRVAAMAATDGRIVATLLSCARSGGSCHGPAPVVWTSPVGHDAWQAIPGVTVLADPVAAHGGMVFGVVYPATSASPRAHLSLVTGPADGSARWVRRALPCTEGAIAVSATTASRLMLSCAMLGEHPAATHIYTSADAGRHWTPVATFGMFDGAGTVQRTGAGTLLVAGIYNGVGLSRNGGRTWTWPRAIDQSDAVGGGDAITAGLFTSSNGYVIVAWGWLWITRDAGRSWRLVSVH